MCFFAIAIIFFAATAVVLGLEHTPSPDQMKGVIIIATGLGIGLIFGGIGLLFLTKAAGMCPVCGEGALKEISRNYTGSKKSKSSTSGSTKTTLYYYEHDLIFECSKCGHTVHKRKYLNE